MPAHVLQDALRQKFNDMRINTDLLYRTAGKFELMGRMLPKVRLMLASHRIPRAVIHGNVVECTGSAQTLDKGNVG